MIVSQTVEYAIRAMAVIAIKESAGDSISAKNLCVEISVPQHYLSKVLRKLVEAKLLLATKGPKGGYVLAKKAQNIYLNQVINAVEVQLPEKKCIFGWRKCNSKEPCILHHRWSAVNEAFLDWAKTTSLEDIKLDAQKSTWLRDRAGKQGK